MRPPAWHVPGAMLGVIAVWGAAFPAIKILLADLTPGGLTSGRLLIAALSYTLLLVVIRPRPVERRRGDIPRLLIAGVAGSAVYHYSLNWGEQHVSAGLASLIVATMPVMTAVVSAAFLGEHLTRRRAAGVTLAFAGVAVLVLAGDGGLEARTVVGVLVTLLAPIAWVIYTTVSKGLAARYDGIRLNLLGAWVGAGVVAPFGLRDLDAFAGMPVTSWLWLAYLGVVSTAAAYVVYGWALRSWSASGVASFVYLVPVASFIWAFLLLGEVPTLGTVAGGALVVVGVVLVQRRSPQRQAARTDAS